MTTKTEVLLGEMETFLRDELPELKEFKEAGAFDMQVWGVNFTERGRPCGFAACAIGWKAHVGDQGLRDIADWDDVAGACWDFNSIAKYYGIKRFQALELFSGSEDTTPEEVADRIADFLENEYRGER